MQRLDKTSPRRTNADQVFDYLQEQITTLQLLPGAKISEAEIAAKFGVSRQPVRDAFSRLDNLDLVMIRPQRATVVRKFSLRAIEMARFVRLSVELEIIHRAALAWDGHLAPQFDANIKAQKQAQATNDVDAFHELDYEFHRLFCIAADAEDAFQIIAENKEKVDRLCVLSLANEESMAVLIDDHVMMVEQLKKNDQNGVTQMARRHLSRLDDTIAEIHRTHAAFFTNDAA